jgi:hypothetical protein
MQHSKTILPKAGARVVITEEPPDLLYGLSGYAKQAILEIIGKPVRLVGYDADGRAELEFLDRDHYLHFIYVDPLYIKPLK